MQLKKLSQSSTKGKWEPGLSHCMYESWEEEALDYTDRDSENAEE